MKGDGKSLLTVWNWQNNGINLSAVAQQMILFVRAHELASFLWIEATGINFVILQKCISYHRYITCGT